jgi:hypothetical protein
MEDFQIGCGGLVVVYSGTHLETLDFWKSKQRTIASFRRFGSSFISSMFFIVRLINNRGSAAMNVGNGFNINICVMSRVIGTDVVIKHTEVGSHLLSHSYSGC